MNESLPKGWISAQVEDVLLSLESGSRPKGGVKGISDGIPSIGGEHLSNDGGFNFTNIRFIPEIYYKKMSNGHIGLDNILIVKDGATTGKVSFINKNFPFKYALVNEHVFILKLSKEIIPKYIFYFLWSNEGFKRIIVNFQGSAQGGINRNFITNTLIPLPPYNEQKRIVAKLDQIIPRINSLQNRLDNIPSIIKRFRQSVLTAAVTGKLTDSWREKHPDIESADELFKKYLKAKKEIKNLTTKTLKQNIVLSDIPINWLWIKLHETGRMKRGKSKHRPRNAEHLYGGDYPFIQTGDISQSNGYIMHHKQTYNDAGLAQSRIWPQNTICITIAANIANSAILTYPACFPDSVVGINVNDNVCILQYVEYYIQTIKEKLSMFAPATAQKNINLSILNEIPFPLPPLEEQKEIVRQVEKLFALADKLEENYQQAKVRIDKLTQSVLAKAFRGELVITEAELAEKEGREFESAEKLLARIMEEKEKIAYNTKKTRKVRKIEH